MLMSTVNDREPLHAVPVQMRALKEMGSVATALLSIIEPRWLPQRTVTTLLNGRQWLS